jgi:hypothetical protein
MPYSPTGSRDSTARPTQARGGQWTLATFHAPARIVPLSPIGHKTSSAAPASHHASCRRPTGAEASSQVTPGHRLC